ncbi:MAG: hypothetical protein Q9191_004993 [Dirinaria sp. TL-2023a]
MNQASTNSPPQQDTRKTTDYNVDFNSSFVIEPLPALTPGSAVQNQPAYHRAVSLSEQDTAYYGPEHLFDRSEDIHSHGLGINASPGDRSSPATPASTNPLLSPPPAHSQSPYVPLENGPKSEGDKAWDETNSLTESYQPFVADLETDSLRKNTAAPTIQSFEPPGFVSLLGALTAMFYTTASDALVAPQLKMGPLEHRLLYGKVATSFANEQYIQQHCQTPITNATDPKYRNSTCIAIEHSGQAYTNQSPALKVLAD